MMVDPHIFQSLILTNTIVAVFCVILLITFLVFILVLLVPSIRRRWFGNNEKEERQFTALSSLTRQPSFRDLSLGSSRFNPIFEPTTGATTTTTTQFRTLFHPQATTATLLHPTIWTSMTPTSLSLQAVPTPPTPRKSSATPPAPSHPPTLTSPIIKGPAAAAAQRSPKKR